MAVSSSPSPLVQRRRLRAELRRARDEAGLTQESVAEAMDWSISKVIRIEQGLVGVSTNDLTALLRLYKIEDARRVTELIALGKAGRQTPWYSKYRGIVNQTLFQFIEYEASASVIRTYEPRLIPGLLQTEEYATTVLRGYRTNPAPEEVQPRVEIRMKRQELLDKSDPPTLFLVLDEGAIRRLMGDKVTRQEQIARLIDLARKPNVTIEIVPFSAGLHSGMSENFTVLEFSDPADNDILYFESAREFLSSAGDDEETSIYRVLFEALREVSLGPTDSLYYLVETAKALT